MTLEEITIEIMRLQAPGVPEQARKAYQRAAMNIMAILANGRTPDLTPPPFGMQHSIVNDIVEAEIICQRHGALENEKLRRLAAR